MNEWIKCSERLPEMHDAGAFKVAGQRLRSEGCLVTVECGGRRFVGRLALVDGKWENVPFRSMGATVIAWMPWPEPFRG